MRPEMTRNLLSAGLAAAAAVALALGTAGWATGGEPPTSWAFAIGNHTLDHPPGEPGMLGVRYDRFDLVVVDGEEASAGEVAAIQSSGATVLAYLSVGTIERWRGWYGQLKRFRLSAWRNWRDEWFADTSRPGFRRAIADRIAPDLVAKGFDGLFLDNTDMVEARRHRPQRAGMARLIAMLDALVRDGGGLLVTQNGAPGMLRGYPRQEVEPLVTHFDGWNREDVTWTYDFDRRRYARIPNAAREDALEELEDVGDEGLMTTATDYVNLTDQGTAAECESVANAVGEGALPYVADIGLTLRAVKANPPDC
jgi:uncharacterized protein (TIGR01370 family)